VAKTYNPIPSVATGDVYTAAAHNAIVENVNGYRVPPMCRLTRTTDQSINSGTETRVQFGTAVFDTDPTMATTGASAKITINTAGVYLVNAESMWQSVSTLTFYRYHYVAVSSTVERIARQGVFHSGGVQAISSSAVVSLAAGATLELFVFHTRGSALDISTTGSALGTTPGAVASLSAAWLGQVS
jgi:hypothetical protein